jgi:hypothetical protein
MHITWNSSRIAVAILLPCAAGCPTAAPTQSIPPDDTPAARLFVGQFDTSVSTSGLNVYRIDAPGDLALEVVAEPVGATCWPPRRYATGRQIPRTALNSNTLRHGCTII